MALYSIYMWVVTKYRKRKERKNPPIVNYDFRPFVSILVPCHNEHEVIEKTAQNILNIDYSDFEKYSVDLAKLPTEKEYKTLIEDIVQDALRNKKIDIEEVMAIDNEKMLRQNRERRVRGREGIDK